MQKLSRKQSKRGPGATKQRNVSKEKNLELQLIKSYPNQICWQVKLPATPIKLTTTVTTGLIANALNVNILGINNFASRFGATFVEYRIIKANFAVKFFSSTNPGIIQFWMDEKVTSAPTSTEALERYVLSSPAAAVDRPRALEWICSDPLDLQYQPIGTTYTPATFKSFTNNTNFGSSIVATDYCEILPHFLFQFRGLQGS